MWQIAAASSVLFAALSLPEFSLAQTKPKQIFALVFCFGPLIAKAAPALAGSLSLSVFSICCQALKPNGISPRQSPCHLPLGFTSSSQSACWFPTLFIPDCGLPQFEVCYVCLPLFLGVKFALLLVCVCVEAYPAGSAGTRGIHHQAGSSAGLHLLPQSGISHATSPSVCSLTCALSAALLSCSLFSPFSLFPLLPIFCHISIVERWCCAYRLVRLSFFCLSPAPPTLCCCSCHCYCCYCRCCCCVREFGPLPDGLQYVNNAW